MSMNSEAVSDKRLPATLAAARKPSRGHGRSASVQVNPRASLQATQSLSALPTRRHSPLIDSVTPAAFDQLPTRPMRRKGTVSAGNTPQLDQDAFKINSAGSEAIPDFEFPPRQTSLGSPLSPKTVRSPSTMHSGQARPLPARASDSISSANSNNTINPITRVMSESSASGTPRSSVDFYSLSNHSDETLTSEVPSQTTNDTAPVTPKTPKSTSRKQTVLGPARPETIMIGYAKINGSFTFDGSLVNAAPFEDVKRKTVQGGGGVVGIERTKRSSGVFGAFGWSNIGESIGGLLGGNEMSTMAQMKASAGSKSVPLLSTPQSLLFVDVTLAPGESKSYAYRFPLPKGLPPSHRGRAMKVEYALSIGVQRLESQTIKYVDVPFRVLGSVNERGESLGHDLMSPYVLLQDAGRAESVATPSFSLSVPVQFPNTSNEIKDPQKEMESFLRYTERLLEAAKDPNNALLSPTDALSPTTTRKTSMFDTAPANTKEAIDFALMNANAVSLNDQQAPGEGQSANRFSIARAGQPVAVLTLLRPAYRLGEALTGNIDFTVSPQISHPVQCQSVHIDLQSNEEVDTALALRSSASTQRVTRRVHASVRENVLFSRKIGFSFPIPSSATPSFDTTGVSLLWTLRIEFTTVRALAPANKPDEQPDESLLEELSRDERGISLIAKERLAAETFEVTIPLKVYGAYSILAADKEPELLEI